ncbi:MAG: 3'-5' exonuclease [Polyangia bacterium]|nr:3'-5' exonuclease [Polyangia bacterium]
MIPGEVNQPQREAILHGEGPLLILAGAGSGKTRVITFRIARLLADGVPPWRIFAVTFTNKAAQEMRHRVRSILGDDPKGLFVSTFHSASSRFIREQPERVGLTRNFVIYDDGDQDRLLKQILKERSIADRTPAFFRSLFDRRKNLSPGAALPEGDPDWDTTAQEVWRRYHRRLRAADAVDFGDLILLAERIVSEDLAAGAGLARRFQHVLVDEFQDTNRVQYLLARGLSQASGNLCVVGDDDQSIYSWRGADLRNILDFENDHPGTKVIKLEQNYRSTGAILGAANAVIRRNLHRKEKSLWTDLGPGEPIEVVACRDERQEAAFVAHSIAALRAEGYRLDDVAVFYRVHAQSRALEEALRAKRLNYAVVGGIRFYDRAEVKDIISYLRLVQNPRADLDLARVLNTPKRGIGKKTLETLERHASERSLSLTEACEETVAPDSTLLGARAARPVKAFLSLMTRLREAAATMPVASLGRYVAEESGLIAALKNEPGLDGEKRVENIQSFLGSLEAYEAESDDPSLAELLERVALVSSADEVGEGAGRASLMTVHAAKGLEFPVVFLTGMEENVFPHQRSILSASQMEEERRLAYVAMTRAKRRLVVTFAGMRTLFGRAQWNEPTRFLGEIPSELLRYDGLEGAEQPRLDESSWQRHKARAAGNFGGGFERDFERDFDDPFEDAAEDDFDDPVEDGFDPDPGFDPGHGPHSDEDDGPGGGPHSDEGNGLSEDPHSDEGEGLSEDPHSDEGEGPGGGPHSDENDGDEARARTPPRISREDLGRDRRRELAAQFPSPAAAQSGRRPVRTPSGRSPGDSKASPALGPGQKVRHPSFGIGTIHACLDEGPNAKLRVYFPAHGAKTILARFVEPA